jgi:hypothetical protein
MDFCPSQDTNTNRLCAALPKNENRNPISSFSYLLLGLLTLLTAVVAYSALRHRMVPVAQLLLNLPGDWVEKQQQLRRDERQKTQGKFSSRFSRP